MHYDCLLNPSEFLGAIESFDPIGLALCDAMAPSMINLSDGLAAARRLHAGRRDLREGGDDNYPDLSFFDYRSGCI